MDIYQMNPQHGRMIVHSPIEAEANHKHGWETVTKEQYYAGIIKDSSDAIEDEDRAKAVDAYKEKFGEAPHHRMKTETILEKINADHS